jgi:FkbM family methyltransferase
MARATAFQLRGRVRGRRTLVPIGDHARMWAVVHHTAASKVAYGNPPDYEDMSAWRRLLKPGDLFVDVGSNVGAYALWAADCGAEVIAVEPSPDAVPLLLDNLELNPGARVSVRICALGSERGEMAFSEGLDTANHLIPDGLGSRVEVRTLDELLEGRTAAGVKIDVEGAERLVLEGGRSALSDGRVRAIQIEWNMASESCLGETRAPIVALLERLGYEFFRADREGHLQPTNPAGYGSDLFALLL